MNSYKPDILTFEELNAKITSKQITLPKFQRNVVWGKAKITKLIESLQKGYPFGSLLLYKKDEENFKLIDGLQRYSAISKYSKEPMAYLPNFDEEFEVLKQQFVELKMEESPKYDADSFERLLEQIQTNLKKYKLEDKMMPILDPIKEIDELKNLRADMMDILETWIKQVQSQIDFANLKIPVIYFEGDEESLTEVFQNINEGGKPLTKYEIFASAWSDYEIQGYKNEAVIKVLNKRYDDLQEELGDLSLDFEFDQDANMNVFEYCFALSKLVANALASVTGQTETEATKIDTIGFSLIAATLGIRNKELHKIGETMRHWSPDSFNQFQQIIVENTKLLMCELYENFSFKGLYFPKPSEFQLVSLIVTRIRIQYDIQKNGLIELRNAPKAELASFKRNIEFYFLKNLLDKSWGNAGDSKLDDAIGLNSDARFLLYLNGLEVKQIMSALEIFMDEQRQSNPKQVSQETKAIIAWLQNKSSQYNGEKPKITKYDIEHIVPKQILKNGKIELVSPLANLCILPVYDNRSKKQETLYEWAQKSGTLTISENDVSNYLYPSKSELEVVSNHFHQLDLETYLQFLTTRQQKITQVFQSYLEKL